MIFFYHTHFNILTLFTRQNNTYQGILITDGEEKSFAVFIFKCDSLNWAGSAATIGFNAGGEYFADHPVSRLHFSNAVACMDHLSVWNNVLYDLTSTENPAHGFGSGIGKSASLTVLLWHMFVQYVLSQYCEFTSLFYLMTFPYYYVADLEFSFGSVLLKCSRLHCLISENHCLWLLQYIGDLYIHQQG